MECGDPSLGEAANYLLENKLSADETPWPKAITTRRVAPNLSRFEQAFSDEAKAWETNWVRPFTQAKERTIMRTDIRRGILAAVVMIAGLTIGVTSGKTQPVKQASVTAEHDGQHDFDWDIGTWKTHQRRLVHPLTGNTTWVDYTGTDVVQKVWDGANVGRIEADGPSGHLEIFTLRLYNPQTHEWSIYFANRGGTLSLPVVGGFKDARAEFYDQEIYNDRTIMVRFSVSEITPNSCHFEQAFSADGGKTWEANFIVTETLVKDESDKTH